MNILVVVCSSICSVLLLLFFFLVVYYMSHYKKVPKGQAMIIYGRGHDIGSDDFNVIAGGGRFVLPSRTVRFMPLEERTLDIEIREVPSRDPSLKVDISLDARVGISKDSWRLRNAVNNFMGFTGQDMQYISRYHIRDSVMNGISNAEIEDIEGNIGTFTENIREDAQNYLDAYGLKIMDLNIRELSSTREDKDNISMDMRVAENSGNGSGT